MGTRWGKDERTRLRPFSPASAKALTSHSPYSTKDETETMRHSSSKGVCYKWGEGVLFIVCQGRFSTVISGSAGCKQQWRRCLIFMRRLDTRGCRVGSGGLAQGLQDRWEPVWFDRLPVKPVRTCSGLFRYETGPNSKFKFELKKWKIPKKFLKILQAAMNLMVSNFLQNSFI